MRRLLPAVLLTLLGLGLLATFQSTPGVRHTLRIASSPRPSTPTTAPPRPTPPTTQPPQAPAPTTQAPAPTTRTVDGDPIDNRYGTVQVRVTLQGNQIAQIQALQLPSDRQRSAEISQGAEPLLQQEALQAQSANIQIVSGATFTSESYAQSLQSALDKAGA
jgi:uncharacterized protein with FMN-binding domain